MLGCDGASNRALGCDFAEIIFSLLHNSFASISIELTQRTIKNILSNCHNLLGHFNHSLLANHEFKKPQNNQNLYLFHMTQDIPTHWNSFLNV